VQFRRIQYGHLQNRLTKIRSRWFKETHLSALPNFVNQAWAAICSGAADSTGFAE
jgi:hypothetical protein